MTKNTYWEVLKDFPPSYINNSREIVRDILEKRDYAIKRFKGSPSMYWANRLSQYGIEVDFDGYQDVFITKEDFNHA